MKTIYYVLIMLLGVIHASAQVFPDYSEHSYWNDSYPIYDAVSYKGKFYALQNHNDGMRLVQFDTNLRSGVMTGDRFWKVGHKSDYNNESDAEIVEYQGSLYIFAFIKYKGYYGTEEMTYAYKFDTDANGTGHLSKIPIGGFYSTPPNIAATVYKGALCLFYADSDNKIYMKYSTTPAHGNWKTVKTIAQPIYAKNMTGQDTWDVCTWYGESEKLVIGLIAGRNMWAYTFDGNPSESENSKWTSVCYENGAPDFGSFSLKLLQGAIKGVGSDINDNAPSNNPVQFIYALQRNIVTDNMHQRQILTNEYYPSANTFGTDTKRDRMSTNLPYGFFGAATLSIPYDHPNEDTDLQLGAGYTLPYQQYICIFRGACDNHFKGDSHYAFIKSNQIRVSNFSINPVNMLKEAELRKLCTLTGVIEGAPPIIIDNEDQYEKVLTGNPEYLSSITLGSTSTKAFSQTSTTGFSVEAGVGPDLDAFTLQVVGGYEMKETKKEDKEVTVRSQNVIFNKSVGSANKGYYIYLVPYLDRYSSTYYSTDGKKPIKGRTTLYSFLQTGMGESYISFDLNNAKIDPFIRVENPMQLESWEKRGSGLFHSVSSNKALFRKHVDVFVKTSEGLGSSASNSYSTTESFHVGGNIVTPGFQFEGNYNFNVEKSNSTSLSQEIIIEIQDITEKNLALSKRDKKYQYYFLEAYFLNNPNDDATRTYYADLKRRGAMIDKEQPFILAWKVSGLSETWMTSAIATSDETIAPDGTRIYNDGDALAVDSPADSRITIYSANGRIMGNRLSDGVQRFPLPRGVYFIHIQHGSTSKVYKAIKR